MIKKKHRGGFRGASILLLYPVAGCQAVEVAFDEGIQGAVHDRVDIAGFAAGAGILDQSVGHEDIVPDLAAPFDYISFFKKVKRKFTRRFGETKGAYNG